MSVRTLNAYPAENAATLPDHPLLDLVTEIAARYEIAAISGLLASVRATTRQEEITVAVLGRFKAGKSSLLNDILGRQILPVGVIPVTAVVTEIRGGAREHARVHFRNGDDREIALDRIGAYIAEKENPENLKGVHRISLEVPELRRFRGLRFVDTPGLESALSHNTQTSLEWLPNVGLALVAISVDPPLSERDLELIRSLYRYTPKVAILLTKADLVSQPELEEIVGFVRRQLARRFSAPPPIFPYSTRPGFEPLRQSLEATLLGQTLDRFAEERDSIVSRKLDTLLAECAGYLALSLKAAETLQSERQALKQQALGEKAALDDVKSQIRLVVQHAAAGTRQMVADRLEKRQHEVELALAEEFDREFPHWTRSLAAMLSSFEAWLAKGLSERLTVLSFEERDFFLDPLHGVQKQAFRALQQFRDRLSEGAMRAFGVPLRTTETEIEATDPATPDIRVGRVFDRNWELLSPVLPVWAIQSTVRRHFARAISYAVYQNLSRLSAQWEQSLNTALQAVRREAARRLEELIGTVERLMESGQVRGPEIRGDLERLYAARKSLGQK